MRRWLLLVAILAALAGVAAGAPSATHRADTWSRRGTARLAAHSGTRVRSRPVTAGHLPSTDAGDARAADAPAADASVTDPPVTDPPMTTGPVAAAPPTSSAPAVAPTPAPVTPSPTGGAPTPPSPASPVTGVPAGWQVSTHDLAVGGLSRSYLMIRPPPTTASSLPVFLVLHGRLLSPQAMERSSQLVAALGPGISVYPAGWGQSWDAGDCCGLAFRSHVDDVTFLNDVLRDVLQTQPDAAARQVYLIGYSNGGRMAMRLACSDPGTFAGLAAVEAVPGGPCDAMRPLPTLLVESSGDPLLTIPASGRPKVMQGYVEPTVGATVAGFQRLDDCRGPATTSTAGDLTTTSWSGCGQGGQLVYDLYRGGSHHWPKGDATTPPAQSVVAGFLLRHPPGR